MEARTHVPTTLESVGSVRSPADDVTGGAHGRQVIDGDTVDTCVEPLRPPAPDRARDDTERTAPPPDLRSTVLLRSEDSGGRVSVVENIVPARSAGPPLHCHDFDEAFYLLEGELVFRVGEELHARTAGQLAFAPRGAAHALANRGDAPARYLLVCTPAGFERQFARMAAQAQGTEPPPWALQPIPGVVRLGPPILREALDHVG